MADSYYPPDGTQDEQAEPAPDGAEPATEGNEDDKGNEDQNDEGETALVSASAFGGKTPKPGDKCMFEVVHCYEDECELKYVPHDDQDDNKNEQPEGEEMAGAMGKLNSMAGSY